METGEKNCASIYAICILAHDGKAINISRFPSTTAFSYGQKTLINVKQLQHCRELHGSPSQQKPRLWGQPETCGWVDDRQWIQITSLNHPAPQRMARILLQEAATKFASLQYRRTHHLDFYQIPSRMTMLHLCKVAQERA